MRLARISLTLSLHVSLSFIASGRSSGLHPVSSHSCCMYVRAGCPAFDWPYVGVHRGTSLTISSLLLQQCPACLVRLACIVFVISGRWPYSWRLVGCCCLFNIAHNILIKDYYYYYYLARWQKLLGDARSGSTALSNRNCVIIPSWRLMRAGYRTCFHMLYDEYIYIFRIS